MKVRAILSVLALVVGMTRAMTGAPPPVSAATVVTISHSTDAMTIVLGNSVACSADAGVTTTENSYFRVFDLPAFGINSDFTVSSVDFGVEALRPQAIPITVNLYTLDGTFVWANLTPIGSSTEMLEPTELSVHTMAVNGVAPAGSTLVVEIAAPDVRDVAAFFIGSNAGGQTGPSYMASNSCGLDEPAATAGIGAPNMHIVMEVSGEVGLDVGEVEVSSTPSDEGQAVSASAPFTPDAVANPVCTVDYGDGSEPQDGTITGGVCTGPAHTYVDGDNTYTVTIEVCDEEGDCGSNSVQHTVANVAPKIDTITTDGPVSPGAPVTITVNASDPGINDVLLYSFDCGADGDWEVLQQIGNTTSCALDPSQTSFPINVLVEDGDGGEATGSVTVNQTVTLCASRYTGALSAPTASGSCPPGSIMLSLPGPAVTTVCLNPYTGAITWKASGSCAPPHRTHIVPDDGPLSYCQSAFTGQLRYSASGACGAYERPGVIPG